MLRSLYTATYMLTGGSLLAYSTSAVPAYLNFEEENKTKDQIHTKHKLTKRELRFIQFASIEYNDVIYMSPMDFIDSLTLDCPRERVYRRVLNDKDLKQILYRTPPFRCGSKDLFRTLDQGGLISYSEYIFLLTLLTKSKTAFKIAFLMFDNDDNGRIDKDEFILIRSLTSTLRSTRGFQSEPSIGDDSCQLDLSDYHFVVPRLHHSLITAINAYPVVLAISKMFAARAAQLHGTRLVPVSLTLAVFMWSLLILPKV
uniref:EF-hand domain-containing protein n=1 Tax=Heterorhabditis bacteriophora TaxID=37862 RepID=A0A1I7XBB4_HETBA